MNNWNGMGRLTKDPELRYTPVGKAICHFSIAVPRNKEESDFFDCEAWEKTGETISNNVKKGQRILIDGRLQQDRWKDNQTQENRSKIKIVVNRFDFIEPANQDPQAPLQQPQTQPQYAPAPYQQPQQNYQPQNHQQGQQPPGQPSYPGQFSHPGYTPQQQPSQGQWQAPPPGYQQPHPNMPNPNFPPPTQQQQPPQWLGQPPHNPPGTGQQIDLNQIGKQVNLGDDIPF